MMADELLKVQDVTRVYEAPAGPHEVLSGVSLCLGRGESVSITGPSGSGKSTLLNIIGGLDSPTAGRVLFEDSDVHSLAGVQAAHFRNRRVGFVFQDHHLFPQCTALENVLMPTIPRAHAGDEAAARAKELLEAVGLSDRHRAFPAELSGGERQRIAVARALVNGPDLLLCDEPTGNLDADTGRAVADLLLNLKQEHPVALIVVTHDPSLAARFGRELRLNEGRLHE